MHIKFHALQAVALAIFIGLVAVCPRWKSNTAALADQRMKPSATPMVIKPKGYSPQAITPESKKGEQYYNQAHCDACHSINDNGGIIGPLLDGIGQHRNSDFLYARLADTPDAVATYARLTRQSPSGLTPHVRLAPQTASSLVAYLLTLPEPKLGFAIFGHKSVAAQEPPPLKPDFQANPTTARTEDGRKLYEKFGCAQCHQIQNAGGYIGPALDGEGQFRNPDEIAGWITDAQVHAVQTDKFFEIVPTMMPKFKATPDEIRKVTEYLLTLPKR